MTASIQRVLAAGFLSSRTPPLVVERLASLCTTLQVPAGVCLFTEGARDSRFSIVAEGQVDLKMNVPGRGDVRILSLGCGDMLGWSALVGGGRMTASATASRETTLLVADGGQLRAACLADHEFGFYIMEHLAVALARRLLATRLQLLDLFAENPADVPATSMLDQLPGV